MYPRFKWPKSGPHPAQQRVTTDVQAEPCVQPRPGASGERQPDRLDSLPRQRRVPGMRAGQPVDLLRKRHRLAVRRRAPEPPDQQVDHDPRPGERGVHKPAAVPVVHPARHRPATRAGPPDGAGADEEPHPVAGTLDPFQDHVREMREQDPKVREAPDT